MIPIVLRQLFLYDFLQLLGELTSLNDRKPNSSDPFERLDEADVVTTSTSVFVAQPGSDASGISFKDYLTNNEINEIQSRDISFKD
jgi:hypothetical protein